VKLVKDTTEILGTISAADDGNSADLMFAPDDLKTGSGTFKVMLVDKTSEKDVDSGEHVELPPQADKDAETPATPDAANPPAGDGAKKTRPAEEETCQMRESTGKWPSTGCHGFAPLLGAKSQVVPSGLILLEVVS